MIPIQLLPVNTSLQNLFSYPMKRLQHGWAHKNPPTQVMHILGASDEELFFAAQVSGKTHATHRLLGSFVEGLWEEDVAELFIAPDATERYWELNLSPDGAWWCCEFESPRVRASAPAPKTDCVRTWAERGESSWCVALGISLNSLGLEREFYSSSRANVTAIVGQQMREYFSWNDLSPQNHDFHVPQQFARTSLQNGPQNSATKR